MAKLRPDLTGPGHGHIMMTMKDGEAHIGAGEFKARCLALLDQVCEAGESFVITKRGRPVARVVPALPPGGKPLLGSVVCNGDIVAPTGESWEGEQ